jgi:cysteine desulfurase / selenocysteine lyase
MHKQLILIGVGLWCIVSLLLFVMCWSKYRSHVSLFKDSPYVPLYNKQMVKYINFDSAASTLPFEGVLQAINEYIPYYSNVHRGYGYSSRYSSELVEQCREKVLEFVHAPKDEFVCIFGKNTTECLNKISWCFTNPSCKCSSGKNVILLTKMEHHSNLLPWRKQDFIDLDYVDITPDGHLDMNDLQMKLAKYSGKISVVSVCGASNVTGIINPLKEISTLVHSAGAMLCVDGAQLVPHTEIDMERDGIDFLCFSAHKMYAPFGIGVLVGRKDFFNTSSPCLVGGGEVRFVTLDDVVWKPTPHKEEEGTPCVIGIVALMEAIRILSSIGMKQVLTMKLNCILMLMKSYPLFLFPLFPCLHPNNNLEF